MTMGRVVFSGRTVPYGQRVDMKELVAACLSRAEEALDISLFSLTQHLLFHSELPELVPSPEEAGPVGNGISMTVHLTKTRRDTYNIVLSFTLPDGVSKFCWIPSPMGLDTPIPRDGAHHMQPININGTLCETDDLRRCYGTVCGHCPCDNDARRALAPAVPPGVVAYWNAVRDVDTPISEFACVELRLLHGAIHIPLHPFSAYVLCGPGTRAVRCGSTSGIHIQVRLPPGVCFLQIPPNTPRSYVTDFPPVCQNLINHLHDTAARVFRPPRARTDIRISAGSGKRAPDEAPETMISFPPHDSRRVGAGLHWLKDNRELVMERIQSGAFARPDSTPETDAKLFGRWCQETTVYAVGWKKPKK